MWVRFTHRCAVWVFVFALQMQKKKKKSVHERPISLASSINLS